VVRNFILATLFLCGAVTAFGERTQYQFARYQVILDRMPFGEPPPAPAAAAQPAQPATKEPAKNSILHSMRICALREVDGGEVRVGFVNIKEKPPKTYFLYKGQVQDGIRVVDVNYEKKMALLHKDGEELWIMMDAGPDGAIPGSQPAVGSKPKPGTKVAGKNANKAEPKKRKSYSERLKKRRKLEQERRKQIAEEKAKYTAEELKQHFKELQMEYIRTGQPALPIQLTPEMDAQLVEEGVLEPVDAAE